MWAAFRGDLTMVKLLTEAGGTLTPWAALGQP